MTTHHNRSCVSLLPLYGGAKQQKQNYTLVPPGTAGIVTYEVQLIEDGYVYGTYYMVRFELEGKGRVWVRCAPHMVNLT